MSIFVYRQYGNDPLSQAELSYSVLSALKHGAESLRLVLLCDEASRRPDLPMETIVTDTRPMALQALKQVAAAQAEKPQSDPICLIANDTAFRAPVSEVAHQITPGTPLVLARDGWLSTNARLAQTADDYGLDLPDGLELLDCSVFGLHPVDIRSSDLHPIDDPLPDDPYNFTQIEQLLISLWIRNTLSTGADLRLAQEQVTCFSGPIRHVYRPKIRAMFPPGQAVNTALAAKLPLIKAPPQPLALRLRAWGYGLRRGMGPGTKRAYLAQLCALSAPTPEGRDIWSNIALDHLENASKSTSEQLQRDFAVFLSPADLNLTEETVRRWRAFWTSQK